jgi:uncharacterized protein (DUF1684 family)
VLWRAKRARDLAAPEGWLSVVGLEWLEPGTNTLGSAPDNRLKLPGQRYSHLGAIQLRQNTLTLLPPAGGFPKVVTVNGRAPKQSQVLSSDDSGKPSKIKAGTLALTVIHRGDRYGLRIRDASAEAICNFRGLHWYARDPKYRIRARWIPYNPPQQRTVPTILRTTETMEVPGIVEFTLDGQKLRLEPVLESPQDKELFFILRDTTSKQTTYGAGRFLYTSFPDHGLSAPGEIWLDFNRLTNPPCAYTPYATCPLPPAGNRLPVALPAGERRFHD